VTTRHHADSPSTQATSRPSGRSTPTALLIVSDRKPLAWLREQRFAVPAGRASSAPAKGTRLLLYTTRGCYRNPGRDRGLDLEVTVTKSHRFG
jgi:hypothetical protein